VEENPVPRLFSWTLKEAEEGKRVWSGTRPSRMRWINLKTQRLSSVRPTRHTSQKRSFSKSASSRTNFKTPALRFRLEGKQFENGTFRNQWRCDFPSWVFLKNTSNTTADYCACVLNWFLWRCVNEALGVQFFRAFSLILKTRLYPNSFISTDFHLRACWSGLEFSR